MSVRRWITTAAAVVLAGAAIAGATPPAEAQALVPVVVLDGTGYGHGVGLSQWGAEHLASTGRSAGDILATFYPGAELAEAAGPVRVAVHKPAAPTTTLTFPQGGEVRSPLDGPQAPGFPVSVAPGGRVRITYDGGYRVDGVVSGQGAATATEYRSDPCLLRTICSPTTPPPPTTAPSTTTAPPPPPSDPGSQPGGDPGGDPGGPAPDGGGPAPGAPGGATSSQTVWAVPADSGVTQVDDRGRAYRGAIEATGGAALRLVNLVDVEDYLRGMAEVPSTWPAAAVQAQAVAARTYALRAMQAGGELCDDARCQVYVGRTAESPGEDAAVAATDGQVLTFQGALAAAVYSADAGGVSATTMEGFGTPDGVYPYLTTVHYETDNPLPWHLEVAVSDLARRCGYPGNLTGVRVGSAGPSGRALTMVLEGDAGERTVDGRQFARSLGLRSTRFSVTLGSAATPPAPPAPSEEAIQALPEETAALARAAVVRPAVHRLDRRAGDLAAAPILPEGLDPRRQRLALLVAAILLAGAAGAHTPIVLAPRPVALGGSRRSARWWARWRALRRGG
ncbi:MAG TPA: SpoIID/LytB domain-containing protein [Acidimicrobiales bacterium]|nr:SpoIID/LytB domain-containing protein [Acidimicrobiales bacterium]